MNTFDKKPTLPSLAHLMTGPFSTSAVKGETESSLANALATSKKTVPKRPQKCTCKQDGTHIPRPRNAFILFRQQHHQSVLDEGNVIKTNPDVSRELGRRWRDLSPDEKEYWNELAEKEKKRHAEKYPGYRYVPRRFGKKGTCPHCRSKQALKLPTTTSASPKSSSSPKSPVSTSTDEHAIAQSFLSLRNQTQAEQVPQHIQHIRHIQHIPNIPPQPLQPQQQQRQEHQHQHLHQHQHPQPQPLPQQQHHQPHLHFHYQHHPPPPQHYTLPTPVPSIYQPAQLKPTLPSLQPYTEQRELQVPSKKVPSLASLLN